MYEQSNVSYARNRAVYDMSGGVSPDVDDCIVVCVPSLGWSVARSLLEAYGKREVQFASEYEDTYYKNLSVSDWDEVQNIISETLGACAMSCTDIIEAIGDVAIAIAQNACVSGGASGAGGTSDPPDPFIDDGSNFPPPFDDRPEYIAWKCKRANIIVSGLQTDMQFLEDTSIVSMVAPFLVAALITPIPFDDIATIVGLVGLWFLEATLDAYLAELIAFLDSEQNDLICSLYEAESAAGARDDFLSLAGSLSFPAQTLLAFFVSFTNTNSLFVESGVYGNLPDTINYDCADCAVINCWCDNFMGVGIDLGGGEFQSEDAGFAHGLSINVNSFGSDVCTDTCGPEVVMNILDLGAWVSLGTGNSFQLHCYGPCTSSSECYRSDTPYPDGTTARIFQIWSTVPFTAMLGC